MEQHFYSVGADDKRRALHQILKARGMKLAILSNGNPDMLAAAVGNARMEDLFSHVMSADTVEKFKTAPEAYQMGTDLLGAAARDIVFVSSNGWDICGASWFGYRTFWVNRADAPMEELGVTPHGQGRLLSDLPPFIAGLTLRRLSIGDAWVSVVFRRTPGEVSVSVIERVGDIRVATTA